jgi:formylmethanofuran dehydrogenase subunit E
VGRKRGKAVRVCLRSDAFRAGPEYLALSKKVQNGKASPRELAQFRQLQQERTQRILHASGESLFKIEETSPDIPPKARIMESGTCDFCGEPTKIELLTEINGKKGCTPCAQRIKPSA